MRIYFILLALCCVIFSCSNDEMAVKQPDDVGTAGISDVKVVNGILKFVSKEHLMNVTKQLGKNEDRENWFKEGNFYSLLKRQNGIKERNLDNIADTGELGSHKDVLFFREDEEGETELRKIVEDARFAAVLNEKSFVIVGDTIYHIEQKGVSYIRMPEKEDALSRFLENPRMEGATFVKTETKYIQNARLSGAQGEIIHADGSKRRYKAGFYSYNAPMYQALVIKMVYQKKNWIGWSGTASNYMRFEAYGTFGFTSGIPLTMAAFESGYNVEEISHFVDEYYGTPDYNLTWFTRDGTAYYWPGGIGPVENSFAFN